MLNISPYIEAYITNFEYVRKEEGYKWKFLKTFKQNWNLEASDFHKMLNSALSDDVNLLVANNRGFQYLPKGTILLIAQHYPEEIRSMFRQLMVNENVDTRIKRFKTRAKELTELCYNNGYLKNNTSHQDTHAISVYLSALFPDLYYIYKFSIYEKFVKLTNYKSKITNGEIGLLYYFRLCEYIRDILINNDKIMTLHNKWLSDNSYSEDFSGTDPTYHLLAQDFIYSVVVHLTPNEQTSEEEPLTITTEIIASDSLKLKPQSTPSFKGIRDNNFFESADKKVLGNLGEEFVMLYERQQLIDKGKPKLAKKIRHISVEEGDGTGFDILSFEPNGKKKFIEVKTTTGDFKQQFFISQTELARSIQEKEQYYLYRVYNFDRETNSGKIKVIQGDLSNICQVPTNYSVKLKE